MKAHRLKLKMTSREEMEDRFESELFKRVESVIREKTKGQGVIAFVEYKMANEAEIRTDEKIKLLEEWEQKGLPTRFNKEPIGELLWNKYFKFRQF